MTRPLLIDFVIDTTSQMESIEQTASHSKRKIGTNHCDEKDNHDHFYAFDIEHEQSNKSFCCRSPLSNPNSLTNYQQTTKIIQEFNIQQSTTSDITVSSTINIKSTPKSTMKMPTNDLLSEADFQRVVQDITPADRDLFDEFLNGIKQKTDDYLFLSSFDDLPSNSIQEQDSISRRHASFSSSTPTSSIMSSDRRRNSIPRGSSTIHYSPNSISISNRPPLPPPSSSTTAAAAQTLKQMAVQHQQRAMYHQQQTTSYSSIPYNQNNSIRQYYQPPESDSTSYYPSACYPPVQQTNLSPYNHHAQQRANIYGIQNYSYQTSSSFYQQQPQPPLPPQQQLSTSSYPMHTYSPSNGLPTTSSTTSFYSPDDTLPMLDL